MSKKHKKSFQSPMGQTLAPAASGVKLSHQGEYRVIKIDLLKVLALNLFYLVVILSLYYGNQHSHFVDNWFARILHF